MDLEDLLKLIRSQDYAGPLKTADHYLQPLNPCVDEACIRSLQDFGSYEQWKKSMEDAKSQLTCLAELNLSRPDVLGWTRETGSFGTHVNISSKGSDRKIETPGAIMEFDAIITSNRKDRDRDILETSGAELDPKSPLLMFHSPMLPVGKLVREVKKTRRRLIATLAIADTQLGQESATLAEFGALRISHGFRPIKWEKIEDKEESDLPNGFRILKFLIWEVSLVPVPSNEDAVILTYSRGKLTHPVLKSWGKLLWDQQPEKVSKTVNLEGLFTKNGNGCSCGGKSHNNKEAECPDCPKCEGDMKGMCRCADCGYESTMKGTDWEEKTETVPSEDVLSEKPYPNEHACRLRDPKDFQPNSFRRTKRKHKGKEYSVIMGRLEQQETMTEQAYRYPKSGWKVSEARSHCRGHDGMNFEPASGTSIEAEEAKEAADTAVSLLAFMYRGVVLDWETLHALKEGIDGSIQAADEEGLSRLIGSI